MAKGAWSARRAEEHLLSLELFGMRFGLERMRRLLLALDSPQETFGSIHVVGTNGKSSTTRMIAAILEAHGLRTGAYLSPHLTSFAERVAVRGADLGADAFGAAVERAALAAEKVDRTLSGGERVTQFELLTAAAFSELAAQGVEVAVVEAGLGGRHDATNVLGSTVQVLTNVGLEHTRWLGPTLADIAREKLAVVRPGSTLVVGRLALEADAEAVQTALRLGARMVRVTPETHFQRTNFAVARAAAEAYLATPLDPRLVAVAAGRVEIPGRFQRIAEDPLTIVDGAHNPSGFTALAAALEEVVAGRPLVAVVSILDDKDAAGMLRVLLPRCAALVLTAAPNPRALPPATLGSLAAQLGWAGETVLEPDPHAALARARRLAGPSGAVIATGSIYLVAGLLSAPGTRRASAL